MWSVPLIAAVAVIGALAAFVTLTPKDASADAHMPGVVQKLMVVPNENGTPQEQLLVTWEAPTDGGPVTQLPHRHLPGWRAVGVLPDRPRQLRPPDRVSHLDAPGLDSADGLKALDERHFRVFAFFDKSATERIFGPGTDEKGATAASMCRRTHQRGGDRRRDRYDHHCRLQHDGDVVDEDLDVVEAEFGLDLNGDGTCSIQ